MPRKALTSICQNQPLPPTDDPLGHRVQRGEGRPGEQAGQGGCLTFVIQQHVLRLEVSVDDAPLVQVLQAAENLGRVEDGARLLEARVLLVHIVDVVPGGRLCGGLCFSGTTIRA